MRNLFAWSPFFFCKSNIFSNQKVQPCFVDWLCTSTFVCERVLMGYICVCWLRLCLWTLWASLLVSICPCVSVSLSVHRGTETQRDHRDTEAHGYTYRHTETQREPPTRRETQRDIQMHTPLRKSYRTLHTVFYRFYVSYFSRRQSHRQKVHSRYQWWYHNCFIVEYNSRKFSFHFILGNSAPVLHK